MGGKPQKAYKNLEFLNSADARILRILSEYLEPSARFKKNNVADTIVFFGSARILDRQRAQKNLDVWKKKQAEHPTEENARLFQIAQKQLELSRYYEDARTLSRMLTEWSKNLNNANRHFLVTSGGGPGIMEAANRGASEVPGGRSLGLNISIPTEQSSNSYITDELNFEFHYFFTRKFWFIYLAKALVVFPGGFGTLDEMCEVLTLLQTKKVLKKMTVLLYGTSYWKQLLNFDFLVENLMINKEDLNLIHFSDTPDEAFKYLKKKLTKDFL